MSPRTSYTPIDRAPQGVGGNNNLGILIVRHTRSHKTYIEKRIRPSAIIFGDIQREIRMMQQARSHPNIVSIADFDLSYKTLGYGSVFMQHCELGSLDALISRYRSRGKWIADEGFAWKVLWDLSIGLAYLWTGQGASTVRRAAAAGDAVPSKRGWDPIVHRDIKPSNVFLTWHDAIDNVPYPTVLLGDFGCAVTSQGRRARTGLPQNDVDFAPPEFPSYSEFGDVYALALTVVCVGWIKQSPPKREMLNGWASEGMEMVLRKCLKREQTSRPSPGELPKYVWRGYQMWCRGRRDFGKSLPEWALRG
jgi:serine/threonine protein kinase